MPPLIYTGNSGGVLNTPLNHDVWQRGALGASAREVYELLLDNYHNCGEPQTARQLSILTGRGLSTVKRALKKMLGEGIVYCDGYFWGAEPIDDSKLDEIARKFGTYGKTAKRKEQHQMERANHAAYEMFRNVR